MSECKMAEALHIRVDDLEGPEVAALLEEHLASMAAISPAGSVHALDLDSLRAPDVTFWIVWKGSERVGCGALKELAPDHGEIKSMRTAPRHRRQGVASALMEHMLEEARRRVYRRLSLETGGTRAFAPARALYARFGFEPCGPFADYVENGFSTFMTRGLEVDLSLRPATSADLEFLFDVRRRTLRDYVEATWGPWRDDWQRRRFLETALLEYTEVILVGGEPAGSITVRQERDAIHLDRIHLRPEVQNRGIGSELIERLIRKARSLRIALRLRVLKVNPARRLYDRLGFSIIQETDTHWGMELPAPGPGIPPGSPEPGS